MRHPANLVEAVGEGVGNNAAHEIAHQLSNTFLSSGKIIHGMDLDDSSHDTYNASDCHGATAPWVYTGSDGTSPIHWESDADRSLLNILGIR